MTTEQITLLIQALGTVGIVGILFFQNRILKSQIEKQTSIISGIESFNKIFDLKKVNEFVEISEKIFERKADLQTTEVKANFMKANEELISMKDSYFETCGQLASLIFDVLEKSERHKFLTDNLPKSKESVLAILKELESNESLTHHTMQGAMRRLAERANNPFQN